jgi:hypothetical protein
MTRSEITNTRDLTFSKWIREKLPDSNTGYLVTDIDFVLYNYKKKVIMILEVKTRNSELKQWQRYFYKDLNGWLRKGMSCDWDYRGIHLLRLENTNLYDGKIYFDNKEITENELIKILSFEDIQ